MFELLGFPTQHSLKAIYVLEELEINYDYRFIDLGKGENQTPEFLKNAPSGKVPVLRHNDDYIFESGAIARYIANVNSSELYPTTAIERARVDQWLDYSSGHIGRWLNTLFFERVIKPKFGMGDTDEVACKVALDYLDVQFPILDKQLSENKFFSGDNISISDLTIYAYVDQVAALEISLEKYPHFNAWYKNMSERPSIIRGKKKIS